MKRHLHAQLIAWKEDPRRKPLVMEGARQVGKTYLLTHFGQEEYEDFAYFNFEQDPHLDDLFQGKLEAERLIEKLSIYREKKIKSKETLIFFDEIQESESALKSLKYFHEQANHYHIVSAGSLLGIKLKYLQGFPVGQVNFLTLRPVSFFEFLEASGKTQLKELLEKKKDIDPLPESFHQELIDLLKIYYYIGGMPEVTQSYLEERDFDKVRHLQKEILKSFEYDFSKHASGNIIHKIRQVWASLPSQLARENKKFTYTAIKKNARARDYEEALQWLVDAGLVQKCVSLTQIGLPLSGYADEHYFKVYLLDVGLLGAMYDLSARTIVEGNNLFTHFKGALVENYVAQELRQQKPSLYYWTSRGQAEIDFVVEHSEKIFPLEVKAGKNARSRSLQEFQKKYQAPHLSCTSLLHFHERNKVIYYPLYAILLFPNLTATVKA